MENLKTITNSVDRISGKFQCGMCGGFNERYDQCFTCRTK